MGHLILACCVTSVNAAFGPFARRSGLSFVRPLIGSRQQAYHAGFPLVHMATTVAAADSKGLDSRVHTGHPENNVPVTLSEKIGRDLHRSPSHPLGIIKNL